MTKLAFHRIPSRWRHDQPVSSVQGGRSIDSVCQRLQSGTTTKYRRRFRRIRNVNVGHIVSVYSIAEVARLAHRSGLPPSLLKEDDVLCVWYPRIFPRPFLEDKLGQCSFLQHQFIWLVHQSMLFWFDCVRMCHCVVPWSTLQKDEPGSPTMIGQDQWQVVIVFRIRVEAG